MSFEEDDHYWWDTTKYDRPMTARERKKHLAGGKHVPNKNEAKVLRNLMAKTGLSEKELREHKVYRKTLSNAQVRKGSKTSFERNVIWAMKQVTRELKLPIEHPQVIEEFKKRMNSSRLQMGLKDLLQIVKKK